MTPQVVSRPIVGAQIVPLGADQANAFLAWLVQGAPQPPEAPQVRFALAHSDAGVTWGYFDEGRWKLASDVDPELCPVPTSQSLHELRLFGAAAEVLIWRADGSLSGRILADDNTSDETVAALRPLDEGRCLRGDSRKEIGGFTYYVDVGGARHLAPSSFPPTFRVRHYLEQDQTTGAVRIAATRLADALHNATGV